MLLATLACAASGAAYADHLPNHISGGGFVDGVGGGNTIIGNETTAYRAHLENCVVNGAGAAREAHGISSTIVGHGAGCLGHYDTCELRGEYIAHQARLYRVVASGYAALEHADAESGVFNGLYCGHSCYARTSSATGESALLGAIVERTKASGKYAGLMAEGEDLIMIGELATTARVPGERMAVSEIVVDAPRTPWVIPGHNLGTPGQRINLFVYADEMPENPHDVWTNGVFCPFTVLDTDTVGYTGNKYAATTPGKNVSVALNTCRPKRSIAIGSNSTITRDDQVVVNGVDVTDTQSKLLDLDYRLREIEEYRWWWPFG